jgi:hypothetical protein
LLTRAFRRGKLTVGGGYQQLKHELYTHTWVVSVREPIKKPHHVLKYLARYTHRVAIANARLISLEDGRVSFRYKDRKHNRVKKTTISAVTFIRRFLLHTLPQGFVRIRHYGFLANRNRTATVNLIRRLLNVPAQLRTMAHSLQEMMLKLTGIDITLCPCCKKGRMQLVAEIPRPRRPHSFALIRAPNCHVQATG